MWMVYPKQYFAHLKLSLLSIYFAQLEQNSDEQKNNFGRVMLTLHPDV